VAHQLPPPPEVADAGKSVVPVLGDLVPGGRLQGAYLQAILPA
jgi:hypothetical protein